MSGVLGTQAYQNYFGKPHGTGQGGITASMPAGSLVGSLCSSFLADRLSRRNAIQIGSLIWILGAVLQAASNGVAMLCVGRVIAGIAIGILLSYRPSISSRNCTQGNPWSCRLPTTVGHYL